MYAVATFRLAYAIDALYLLIIPTIFLYIALAAWTAAMVGLIRQLVRR
jgi:hypothetical protein